MRLKKEYSQMVKKESTKAVEKDKDFYSEVHSKSPDRSGAHTVVGYYAHSHQNSVMQKSPYIHNNNMTTNGSDYNGSNKKRSTGNINADKQILKDNNGKSLKLYHQIA